MPRQRRRGSRTLLLAEVTEDEGQALGAAGATAGLRAVLVAAPTYVELRAAEPLLLLVFVGRYVWELAWARYAPGARPVAVIA